MYMYMYMYIYIYMLLVVVVVVVVVVVAKSLGQKIGRRARKSLLLWQLAVVCVHPVRLLLRPHLTRDPFGLA